MREGVFTVVEVHSQWKRGQPFCLTLALHLEKGEETGGSSSTTDEEESLLSPSSRRGGCAR